MKILVIGGSYFLGRWFVQLTYKENDITVLNRGNIPVGLNGVTEIVADRHNESELCKLDESGEAYDAVVDFCAYNAGDIRGILKHLESRLPERYIYVSTVDVYKKGTGLVLDESAGLADVSMIAGRTDPACDEDVYIRGKAALEEELVTECAGYGIRGVSVRPVILYGPGNYAPRESVYFEWIKRAGQILHPVDADGHFQMLYVKNAASGLVRLCEMPSGELKSAYNFCTDETVTYDLFESALAGACARNDPAVSDGKAFARVDVTVDTVLRQGLPLPFPLTKGESEKYSGGLFKELNVDVTPLEEGLYECMRSL